MINCGHPLDYLPTKRFVIPALIGTVGLTAVFFYRLGNSHGEAGALSYNNQTAAATESQTVNPQTAYEQGYLGVAPDKSKDDLSVNTAGNTAALKAYGIALAEIMNQFGSATHESEPQLMFQALEKGDSKKALAEIKKLEALQDTYHRTSLNLVALEVPSELADLHLAITNSITRLETHVENMANILKDPLKAISSADEYIKENQNLYLSLSAVNTFFTERNIVFAENEKGKVILYEVE